MSATTNITVAGELTKGDPQDRPVLIIGQLKHLNLLKFEDVQCKLAPRVTKEVFKAAVSGLHPAPTDSCSLYLNLATVAALPVKCSRHNTPSRSHAITRLVAAGTVGVDETILIVCERRDVYASVCAVARAYPLYSRRTSATANKAVNVSLELLIAPSAGEVGFSSQLTTPEIKTLQDAIYGIRLTARIVDTPCNEMNVHYFLEEIKQVGNALNITPTIIRGEELAERGFGGIYGVGKAATSPPALAILSHTPAGAVKTVAWVGKGIVYDTGGLSIKGKTDMPGMKRDCGGAAAILGAFYAMVKAEFAQNLHAIFCLAENSVGPLATRPDDIHTLYSGKTVEINNTDAEGRLVLADGVCYAQKDLKANIILDMATLTGAQSVATGKHHAAVLTNTGEWEDIAVQAGLVSGDLVFPIPYVPELHFRELASAMADMKNSVADRTNAPASCAGLFIAAHLGFGFDGVWVHLDIASPAFSEERATGYGVALLSTMFGSYCDRAILSDLAPDLASASEHCAKKIKNN